MKRGNKAEMSEEELGPKTSGPQVLRGLCHMKFVSKKVPAAADFFGSGTAFSVQLACLNIA